MEEFKNAIQDYVMTGEPTIPTFAVYFSEEAPEKAEWPSVGLITGYLLCEVGGKDELNMVCLRED